MLADARPGPREWGLAVAVAMTLHAAVVLELPRERVSALGRSAGTPEGSTRVRLSLGGPPPAAPQAASAPPAPALRPPPTKPPPRAAKPPEPAPKPPPTPAAPVVKPAPAPVEPSPVAAAVAPAPVSAPAPGSATEASTSTGAGEDAGTAARGEEAARAQARGDYFGSVFARFREMLVYPRRGRLERMEGTVVVGIRVDRTGAVERVWVVEGSGHRTLDRHAVRTARRAGPYGRVPDDLRDEDLEFELPVDFVLQD